MLLNINNLTVSVKGEDKPIVSDVNVRVYRGEIVALVGASGSGKTTTGLAAMRLLAPALSVDSGEILWKGENILTFTGREIQQARGAEIAMVFQEPLNAFNPVFRIEDQIHEVLRAHTDLRKRDRVDQVAKLLKRAGIDDAQRIMKSYPHQLSGGLRQRAMIAQALAGDPKLIIADEPTSSIDVTLQAKIVELFKSLKHKFNLSILLITHDLGLVRHLADRVYVMSGGRVVESGTVLKIMDSPKEDYTKELIKATM